MTNKLFKFTSPFLDKKRARHIPVIPVWTENFSAWVKKQSPYIRGVCKDSGFQGQSGRALVARNAAGDADKVIIGIKKSCAVYDIAPAVAALQQALAKDAIKTCSFYLSDESLSHEERENASVGWGFACYSFNAYKSNAQDYPALVWPRGVDKKRVLSMVENVHFLRNLINAPSNVMGPDELEAEARHVARRHKADMEVIRDKKLQTGFPLIHVVGQGSDRRPRLIDITWGDRKNPLVTLVGKGVCFDTGGLNIKPTSSMALMKKDMGGAAHALTLGNLIMDLNLPVRLRILIPAVENSISGSAFRPGDIMKSRKGLTVENTNTDAEGRLILADTLTYACEEKPDLLLDFATLTGSARAALGPDIPPLFSNTDKVAVKLKEISFDVEDPVWPMPLWPAYKKIIESPVADLLNSSGVPGDLVYSAMFLQQFLSGTPDWVHLDIYAWEHSGRPGRPRGGADTGLRAALAFMEDRYGKDKRKRKK